MDKLQHVTKTGGADKSNRISTRNAKIQYTPNPYKMDPEAQKRTMLK